MNLKAYTLSVSLAATIGLLLAVVPLVRNTLEYRQPWTAISEPQELGSLQAFATAKAKGAEARRALRYPEEWQEVYDTAKAQYAENARLQIESARQSAARNIVAYGSLTGLCVVLLITHLLWARRVS